MYYVLISLIRRGNMRREVWWPPRDPACKYRRQIKKNSQPSPNSAQDLFYENKKTALKTVNLQ
jgi:hypothetical protein